MYLFIHRLIVILEMFIIINFAITWSGKKLPILYHLQGLYFNELSSRSLIWSIHQKIIDSNTTSMVIYGVPGLYYGQSYVKALKPFNFDTSLLQY